jgi:MFS family permease
MAGASDEQAPERAAEHAAGERRTSGSLWRHADFMRLWTGQTISQLGSQVTLIALPLTAILLFDATPFQVGLLYSVEFLPFLLLGLPVGAWTDRVRRKPILVAADIGRFVAIGSIPVAYAFGVLHLTQLYVVALLAGIGTLFFDVAYGAYLPALIRRDQLMEGNARLEFSRSAAQLAGPGLGGILVQTFSAPGALAVDAFSYLASVVSLLLIRAREPAPAVDTAGARMRTQVAEGIRYIRHQPLIWPILACTAALNFFLILLEAVVLVFAVRALGLTAGEIGLILTLGSIGYVAGAIVSQRVERRLGIGPTLIGAALLCGAGAIFVPLATAGSAWPLLISWGLISGFGGVIYNINARSLMQTITPDRLLGRVIATNRTIVWGVIPIGSFLGGVLGTAIGLRPTLWIGAIGALVAFAPLALSPIRSLVRLPDTEAESDGLPTSPDVAAILDDHPPGITQP